MLTILIISLAIATAAGAVWASASIHSPFYLRSLCRRSEAGAVVALTFDDGPDPVRTPELLEVLARHDVKATFFLTGKQVAANPELVRRIVAEGHVVGNHTYSHSGWFPLLNLRNTVRELDDASRAIEEVTALRPRLFRPPFGVTNPTIARAVKELRLLPIGWSIRSFDTVSRTPRAKVLARMMRRLHAGAVILLHDRCPGSAALTEALLGELRRRWIRTTTFDKLFNVKAYED